MSNPVPGHDPEGYTLPEDEITLAQAIEEMYDPYDSVVRENVASFIQEQSDRRVEYAN